MKHRTPTLFLLLILSLFSSIALAQTESYIYFEEEFDYVAGSALVSNPVSKEQNLDSITGWSTRSNSGAVTTIYTVSQSPLFYKGYPFSGVGKGMTCNGQEGQTIYKGFLDSGSIRLVDDCAYIAFMINMPTGQSVGGFDYFLGLKDSSSSGSSTCAVRMRAKIASNQVTYGATHYNEGTVTWGETTYPAGETQLVIIKYYYGADTTYDSDDKAMIFVNPDLTTGELNDEDALITVYSDDNDIYVGGSAGMYGVTLRSATYGDNPAYQLSGLRVANTYEQLFSDYTGDASVELESDIDLSPSAIYQDGTLIDNFSSTTRLYEISLHGHTTVIPVITATAASDEATITITQATSLTGTEEERTATVTISDGTISRDYTIIFSLGDTGRIATPTDDTYVYNSDVIYGLSDIMEVRYSATSKWARVAFLKFDLTSFATQIDDVKVKIYTSGFTHTTAHNFQLYPVSINSWSEDNITYTNYTEKVGANVTTLLASYPIEASEVVGAQYLEFSSDALTQIVRDSLDAGCEYISFRLDEEPADASTTTTEFHSKENMSGYAPQLVVYESDVELVKAATITLDGTPLSTFSELTYKYTYDLDWDATVIPTVAATAKYSEAVVTVSQATSLVGTVSESTAVVSITNDGMTLNYSIVFELGAPPTEPRLDMIYIDGEELEYFDTDTYTYTHYLPYTADGVPSITAVNTDPYASYEVSDATSIDPAISESNRVTTISSTSANGEVFATYTILFEQLPKLDLILSIGQSNMAGRADFSDYTAEMPNIFISTDAGGMEVASNPLNKYSNIRKDISIQGLSPAYNCLLDVQAAVGEKIGYVGNSQGGSSITAWYQPGKENYDYTMARALAAKAYGEYTAVIWHQGESDKSKDFDDYKTNMATMVANLRADLDAPDLVFICGELSQLDDRIDFNEQVMQTVAEYIDNADWVSTEGTALFDGTHFDTESVLLIGTRYGEKVLEHAYPDIQTDIIEGNIVLPLQCYVSENVAYISQTDYAASYTVSDASGSTLKTGTLSSGISRIDMPYAPGMYIITMISNQTTYVKKLIIK